MLIGEREKQKYNESIYQLYSVLTTEFLFTMVGDNVELNWVEKGNKRFFLLLLLLSLSLFLYSLPFNFQFSLFFYLFHSPTSSSPTGSRIDWTYIHKKDKCIYQCSHFFFSCLLDVFSSLSLCLSRHSFPTINNFYACMFCSSNVTHTVRSKRMFPLTVPTSPSPCRVRIIIDS
jgi:hypothetical protein